MDGVDAELAEDVGILRRKNHGGVGFGTFEVSKRAARTGKNPQTGEAIKIPASKAPKFKAGKALKDLVNKK